MEKYNRLILYFAVLLLLNVLLASAAWGSAYLSIIIAITYLFFTPDKILHPNNMLFAFSGLYIILPSTLNIVLELINWEYLLPGGQQIFWSTISSYVLFQAEFTYLVLFLASIIFLLHQMACQLTPIVHLSLLIKYSWASCMS